MGHTRSALEGSTRLGKCRQSRCFSCISSNALLLRYTEPRTLLNFCLALWAIWGGPENFFAQAEHLLFSDIGSAEGFAACYFSLFLRIRVLGIEVQEEYYQECERKMKRLIVEDSSSAVMGRLAFCHANASLTDLSGGHMFYFYDGSFRGFESLTNDEATYTNKFAIMRNILLTETFILLGSTSLNPATLRSFMSLHQPRTQITCTWFLPGCSCADGADFATPRGHTLAYHQIKSQAFCGAGGMHSAVHIWYRKDLVNSTAIGSISLADPRLQSLCAPLIAATISDGPQVFF